MVTILGLRIPEIYWSPELCWAFFTLFLIQNLFFWLCMDEKNFNLWWWEREFWDFSTWYQWNYRKPPFWMTFPLLANCALFWKFEQPLFWWWMELDDYYGKLYGKTEEEYFKDE
eukprot:gnl/TRDRNA2_/TRDRNA2_186006_c0_seq1.p1 gnl/TRDRNA2_/TRDRNA2_186006_c0~~gnl/TRDRNA2_/TRDRNA2_186006_c0_seq1.p1  ORF type:complete len:114 (-),score=12.45 gnl/TRDRNA2_/TRDRNA2_186006_c0_seq1:42-383(-)